MALTESYMLPLGTKAPDFKLINTANNKYESRDQLKGEKGTLIIFMCNHCPYVVHLLDAIVSYSKELKTIGISTVAISSNSVDSHPQDGPEEMKQLSDKMQFDFAYLFDETQEVAHSYQAACTPDFYLFDHELKLYYRGRFDASRPSNDIAITGEDLRNASKKLLTNTSLEGMQYPSMGCNIKWKPGNEPNNSAI